VLPSDRLPHIHVLVADQMSSVEVLAPAGFSQQDDTQVAPTQELQSFHENSRSFKLRHSESGDAIEHDAHTYETGDTGYVNLGGDEDEHDETLAYIGNDESQNTHTQTQTQVEMTVTSPASPPFITVNHAGHKRDLRGNFRTNSNQDIISPKPRTPPQDLGALFNFGKSNEEVDLGGLFGQTQANQTPAAPLVDAWTFNRPSPVERHSQDGDQSSPVKHADGTSHPAAQSRDVYVSMRESQDNRRKKRQSEEARSSSPVDAFDDDDDELGDDSARIRIERRLQKAKLEQEANEKFAALGSSANRDLPGGLHSRGRSISGAIDLITPATVRQKTDTIYISDDIRVEEEDLGDAGNSSDAESVDEFDELSQAVIASDGVDEHVLGPMPSHGRKARSRSAGKTSSPVRRSLLPPQVLNHTRRTFHTLPATQQSGSYSLHSHSQSRIRVPNSQPDNLLLQGSNSVIARPPRPIMPSSINSQGFISESQSLGLTISSGRAEYSNFTMPQESIVSSIPVAPVLRDTSSQTSKTGEEVDDERHEQREDSPDSSPPPQLPESSKHEVAEPVVSLPDDPLVEVEMPDADDSHHQASMSAHDVDELGLPSVEHAARKPRSDKLNSPDVILDSDDTRARLSNRKRHQIQESSQPASSAGNTRSAPSHQYTSALAQQDDDHEDKANTGSAPPSDHVSNATQKITGSFYCTAPDSTTPVKPPSSIAPLASPPLQSRPILKMSDIAMQASPEPSSAEVDFNKVNVMDDEDNMFHAIVSPPRKRIRRHYGRNALPVSPQAAETSSILSSPPSNSPPLRKSVRIARHHSSEVEPSVAPPDIETSPNVSNGKLKRLRSGLRQGGAHEVSSTTKSTARFEIQETPQSGDIPPPPKSKPVVEGNIDDEDPLSRDVPEQVDLSVRSEDVHMPDAPTLSSSDAALVVPDRISTPNAAEHLNVPDRVLARFNGSSSMAFYPATCLGPVKPGASVQKVRFDDGTVTELEAHLVRRFELHPGEIVRVDLPDKKKKTWVVKGFLNRVDTVETQSKENVVTDVNGFTTVRLEEKQRKSLPAAGQVQEVETIDADFSDIYLTLQMWNQLKGRSYKHARAVVSSARLTTPFNMITAPAMPSSRTRRKTLGDVVPPSRTISLQSEARTGLFANMAFAITYSVDRDSYRNRVSRLILSNGGSILSDGFDELFEPTSPPPMSPTKSPALHNPMLNTKLKLTTEAAKLGFTALIADTHCRKAKYMQALALNIPCLSGRWIVDSIEAGKLLDWTKYLLPAGESSFLHGAIRSRTFSEAQLGVNIPGSAKLTSIVDQRCKLAEDKNIILITGTSKIVEEKRKPYLFLMCALGATRIQKVRDLNAAKALLEKGQDKWDWVYVDDAKVAKVEERLGFGTGAVPVSGIRKRKRGLEDEDEAESPRISRGKIKVVNDEFVVQSLILGALVE
jgi:hypothetical protein